MEIFEKIKVEVEGVPVNEVLSKEEQSRIRGELATPEILPCGFDETLKGWLARIDTWGKVRIYHKDPENFWGKRKISKNQFLKRMQTEYLAKLLGDWEIKKNSLTKCTFIRDYYDPKGRHRKERFIVDVKLKKELR